jgi:hypothetical protein
LYQNAMLKQLAVSREQAMSPQPFPVAPQQIQNNKWSEAVVKGKHTIAK